jgi:hypothetical protein
MAAKDDSGERAPTILARMLAAHPAKRSWWTLKKLAERLPKDRHDVSEVLRLCLHDSPARNLSPQYSREKFKVLPGVVVGPTPAVSDSDSEDSVYYPEDEENVICVFPGGLSAWRSESHPPDQTILAIAMALCDVEAAAAALTGGADPNQTVGESSIAVSSISFVKYLEPSHIGAPLAIFQLLKDHGASMGEEEAESLLQILPPPHEQGWESTLYDLICEVVPPDRVVEHVIAGSKEYGMTRIHRARILSDALETGAVTSGLLESLNDSFPFAARDPCASVLAKRVQPPPAILEEIVRLAAEAQNWTRLDVVLSSCEGARELLHRLFPLCRETDPQRLRYLLDSGADLFCEVLHKNWYRPPAVVGILVEAGVDPNRLNSKGYTPLATAAKSCPPRLVGPWCRALIQAGASVSGSPSPIRLIGDRIERLSFPDSIGSTLIPAALAMVEGGCAIPDDLIETFLRRMAGDSFVEIDGWRYDDLLRQVRSDLSARKSTTK